MLSVSCYVFHVNAPRVTLYDSHKCSTFHVICFRKMLYISYYMFHVNALRSCYMFHVNALRVCVCVNITVIYTIDTTE